MKQQIFIDDIHEYDYELVEDSLHNLQHVLTYSNGEQWTNLYKGVVASTIKDDGNGLILSLYNKEKLDYSEAERLLILLKLITQPAKYEIAEKKLL